MHNKCLEERRTVKIDKKESGWEGIGGHEGRVKEGPVIGMRSEEVKKRRTGQ